MTSLSLMSLSQKRRDRLREAVQNCNIDDIKRILSSGVDVNADVFPPVSSYYMLYVRM